LNTERDATSLILENNLFGLDIDDRAYQLAYFAVMMKARSYDRRILTRDIKPNVYSIKESNFLADSWQKISDDEKFRKIFQTVVDTFIDAKEYGSILNVPDADYDYALSVIDDFEQSVPVDFEAQILRGKTDDIRALVNQAKLMAKKYTAVVTNPPYMNKFDAKLKKYIADNFAEYKGDLFSVFMYHNFSFCTPDGYSAFMTPNVWMFVKSYEALRKYIINYRGISSLIQMAKGAFFKEATVDICAFVLHNSHNDLGDFIRLEDFKGDMEVQKQKVLEAIENKKCGYFYEAKQNDFRRIPGSPLAYWATEAITEVFQNNKLLTEIANPRQGLITGDVNRFVRKWYECSLTNLNLSAKISDPQRIGKWFPYCNGGAYRKWYGNNDDVVNWLNDGVEVKGFVDDKGKQRSRPQNQQYYYREGGTWSAISSSSFSVRYFPEGFLFSNAGMAIYAKHNQLLYLIGFLNSKLSQAYLGLFNEGLNYNQGDIAKLPIVKSEIEDKVCKKVMETVEISKAEWDSFEISWDFKRNPLV
jgi:type II restriction/modification system DNA methylase subunit YeeA